MNERIDLSPLDALSPAERETRIADRVMRGVRARPTPRRPTLADEILAASRPAVLAGALLAVMAWTIGLGATSTPETQPIGVAHALGLSDATAQIARQNRAPTLEQVLIVFGQAP